MELHSMPQLDKSSYSDIHYVERSNLPNTSIPLDVKKFSPVSGDILTSSAWSAVIHHPAEDSEPEDLPSTVDMDAIKGSPTTSMQTSGVVPWSESDRCQTAGANDESDSDDDDDDDDEDEEDEDDDEEEDEDEAPKEREDSSTDNESSSPNSEGDEADSESGTAQGSASDSDSESSSKNSYDSDSDSASSDSSCTSRSSDSSQSSSSPSPKKCSNQGQDKHTSPQESGSKTKANVQWNDKIHGKCDGGSNVSSVKVEEKPGDRLAAVRKEDERQHRKDLLVAHVKDESVDQRWHSKREIPQAPSRVKIDTGETREKVREMTAKPSLRIIRRNIRETETRVPQLLNKTKGSNDEVSSSRPNVGKVPALYCTSSSALKAVPCGGEMKSDQKAILNSTSQTSCATNAASSDVELPNQVVNDAIKRINMESKSKMGPSTARVQNKQNNLVISSDDETERKTQYSSSLLKKFVESSEQIPRKHNLSEACTSGPKHFSSKGNNRAPKDVVRYRHGPNSQHPSTTSTGLHRGGPADLEVYCSVSNVSPDSGIYCVNGSPWHQSSPAHSPQHPPQQMLKIRPSPPHPTQDQRRKHSSSKLDPTLSSKCSKKSSSRAELHKDVRVPPILSVNDSDDESLSLSPLLSAPAKRGRGRPKKAPPVLEPCLPFSSKTSSKQMYSVHSKQSNRRKQATKKESESSDQSEERCDRIVTYSTHRSREVQTTSQGVQCDQSEFPQIRSTESKKKKRNQVCQSNQLKSSNFLRPCSGKEKEKLHRKVDTLQTVCDHLKKPYDTLTYGHGPASHAKTPLPNVTMDSVPLKRTSLSKQDSSPSCSQSSSSSKRRLPSNVEKRKKGRRRGHAARLAAAAAALLSSSSSVSTRQDSSFSIASHPSPSSSSSRLSKSQRPVEKVVSLPRGLKHHKHNKKHHRRKLKKHSNSSMYVDPNFLKELEKLITDFQRCCIRPPCQPLPRCGDANKLPSIFRVKRILKKRKGSERSKNSDRDSGPEGENGNFSTNPAPRDSRDKGSAGGKRRLKKSAVETPKGQRPEANNEQRLPLKKRHYHMSSAPNHQSGLTSSPEMSLDISSSAEDKRSNNDDSPTSSISSKTSGGSASTQESRGNPSLSTPNPPDKTGLSSNLSSTNADTHAQSLAPVSGKAAASLADNMISKTHLASCSTVKSISPVSIGTMCDKVTVVMPATSSSSSSRDFRTGESNIQSKADSSASFASVSGKSETVLHRVTIPSSDEKSHPANSSSGLTSTNRYDLHSASCSQNSQERLNSIADPKYSGTESAASMFCESLSSSAENSFSNQVAHSSGSLSKASACENTIASDAQESSALCSPVKSIADSSLVINVSDVKLSRNELKFQSCESSDCSSSSVLKTESAASNCKNTVMSSGNLSDQSSNSIDNTPSLVADGKSIRNSVDEAIEACISKYSCDASSANLPPRSVITTPKKRHRMEMQGKAGGNKGKEIETNLLSSSNSSSTSQAQKRPNSRSSSSLGGHVVSCLPPSRAVSPDSSKLPESGIFEPSSSSDHYVVDVPLPATPVKSVIAGLSKLKGSVSAACYKPVESLTGPPSMLDSFTVTNHNLRQKKSNLGAQLEGESNNSSISGKSSIFQTELNHSKVEEDLKSSTKVKPKSKSEGSEKNNHNLKLETEVKIENKEVSDAENNSSELKELRVHVEKLSRTSIPPAQSKDVAAKNTNALPKRRRKCNRTGFPVKRKKKKKDISLCENHEENVQELDGTSTGILLKKKEQSSSSLDISEFDSLDPSQPLHHFPHSKRRLVRPDPAISDGAIPLKEEICDGLNPSNEKQTVILKVDDCMPMAKENNPFKQETKLTEPSSTVVPSSIPVDIKGPVHPEELPYTDRLPNTEKYMYAGLTRRLDPKVKSKVRKPSKAVLRAMRAKFSENIPLPTGSNKGTRLPSSWSSDESDELVDDPYEFNDTPPYPPSPNPPPPPPPNPPALSSLNVAPSPFELMKTENPETSQEQNEKHEESEELLLKFRKSSSRKQPKRDMKRAAVCTSELPVKSKCTKSEKEENLSSALKKPKSSLQDPRRRNKRKNECDESSSNTDHRNNRWKKRIRTSLKIDTDHLDSDCDESVIDEPQAPITDGPEEPQSEDETAKNDMKDAKQPRWRKKYLPAGLFSDYFKLDEPRTGSDGKKGLQYRPEDHPHGLLPPPFHCGKWLRQRRVNFQLPYDLWWLHTHNKLPGRDIVPSWNYKKIRTNVYCNVKPSHLHEPQSCNCKEPENGGKGCGDDCINRLVYAECSPSLCPLRDLCSNQKIQRHEWAAGLERFMTKEKGWGIRAKLPIKSGEFILEYVGEVVSDKEFKERMATIYTKDTHHYCLHLDGGLVIDGHRMGGDGRFVNHSCEPNCEMQKWSVNGLFRMALFALRDIEANEELGYDYNFSLFNAAEGQPCKCGSSQCRGVIGGKSQRVNVLPSSQNGSSSKVSVEDMTEKKGNRKNKRKTSRKNEKETTAENMRQKKRIEAQRLSQLLTQNIRQMSHQQRLFVQQHHCFLLRNLEKVRRLKQKLQHAAQRTEGLNRPPPNVKQSDVFYTQLNALSIPRNVRTRRLAQAEDNPELARNARLACVLRELFNAVVSAKDENGEVLSSPFVLLPNKRKLPLYYVRVREPLDFSTVEQNINSGLYCNVEAFDLDICKILNNNLRFYGRTTNLGIAAVRLKKVYLDAKKEAYPQLVDVLGETLPASFIAEKIPEEEEDVIRCICGLYRDEGMMIQCERCLVWQHCDCVKADSSVENYLCEICKPRPVDLEIPMDPQPDHSPEGQTEFVTLLRSDLQIRQGDTVYVLRDVTEGEGESQAKVTYKTIKDPKYGDMDIFRIERLWKDEKGERFAFGHHYLRPHETYHEPTRKFYPNEVMRVPLYEVISLDLIWARCWVLDPMTYCKGRPIEAVEEHVYICEYRVDKTAHLFYKISKSQSRANLCLKSYAFDTFETRLKPVRTYSPHGPVPPLKPRVRGNQDDTSSTKSMLQPSSVVEEEEEVSQARREKQKARLNGVLLRLLGNQQCKQPLDMSYLLDPGRRPRKKPASLNT